VDARTRRRRDRVGYSTGVRQEIRFCAAPDGTRIAYAIHGSGPPLVRTATWLTHLEFDWESPVWRHWLDGLAEGHTVIRYDERGCGLSDRDVEDFSLDARVADLEAVIDAAGFEQVDLLGMSQGGPVAVAYSARHPERVAHLVLFATYARGRLMRDPSAPARAQAELMTSLIRMGWGQSQFAFRRLFTTLFIPDATPEQMEWFDDLQRVTTEPETALRIRHARNHDEVVEEARRVTVPTLVLHPRDDALVPFSEGRLLATRIPGARFVGLDGRNHIPLADDPAWDQFRAELHAFLGTVVETPSTGDLADLSSREREVLALVAEGLSNEEIAARLYLSNRTVERHLSNIYAKLRVSGKAARAAAAARFSRLREPPAVSR
jgi:pimeloyl-ACP methyl ester carboxylesterase/DNA-binding CsgD family transcriptional regulator